MAYLGSIPRQGTGGAANAPHDRKDCPMADKGNEVVTPLDLQLGDIVWESGLRLEVETITTYPAWPYGQPGPVASAHCRITNPEILQTEGGRYLFGGIIPLDGSSGWTVQGNSFARVVREVTA